jgi:succinate dehydrogenase / fumarate reductase cytochrome b subunit
MLQHLTLNSFSLAGPDKFNGVLAFFDSIPWYVLLTLEIFLIWLPILFHAIYGLFIFYRAEPNSFGTKYGWSQNRMFTFQRYSGVIVFFFLIYHVITTTGDKYLHHGTQNIDFAAWHSKFLETGPIGYVLLGVYLIGILAASYHLAYGVWNFCIRWGITISDKAQARVQKFSMGMFIVVTLLGWSAILGFLQSPYPTPATTTSDNPTTITSPLNQGV